MECLGLHNKPKTEVHPGHLLAGPKEEEEEEEEDDEDEEGEEEEEEEGGEEEEEEEEQIIHSQTKRNAHRFPFIAVLSMTAVTGMSRRTQAFCVTSQFVYLMISW
jgi:hypothetical protein